MMHMRSMHCISKVQVVTDKWHVRSATSCQPGEGCHVESQWLRNISIDDIMQLG